MVSGLDELDAGTWGPFDELAHRHELAVEGGPVERSRAAGGVGLREEGRGNVREQIREELFLFFIL